MKTKQPVTELGVSGCEGYGCRIYVCSNDETVRQYAGCDEYEDQDLRDECAAAREAAVDILDDAGLEYQLDGNFSHWHGGPHSGVVQLDFYRSDVEDEGEGDEPERFAYAGNWSYVKADGVPDAIKAQAQSAVDRAADAMAETMQSLCAAKSGGDEM